jgi:cytochrome b561
MVSASTYSRTAIILHWLIALLIIGQLAGGLFMENLPPTSFKFELYQWHKSFGIMILLLSFARLGWRFTRKPPALPDGMKAWEKLAARGTHIGFYVLMIGVPLSGWAMVSASVYDIDTVLFKLIPWPHIPGIPQEAGLEDTLKFAHEILAKAVIVLLLLHVGAALKHHLVKKDDVLTRMIPLLKR